MFVDDYLCFVDAVLYVSRREVVGCAYEGQCDLGRVVVVTFEC